MVREILLRMISEVVQTQRGTYIVKSMHFALMVLLHNTNRNMKSECGVLTTNTDFQIVSVLIYKWG
jgi:hypothetical protein